MIEGELGNGKSLDLGRIRLDWRGAGRVRDEERRGMDVGKFGRRIGRIQIELGKTIRPLERGPNLF